MQDTAHDGEIVHCSDSPDPWFDDPAETEHGDGQIDEYDITASPNDFNVRTIFDFISSGAVIVPGFQRNYVWDIRRASKLIESLIIGLPIPQIFLYEQGRNKFLVIDGQQRLMSLYYFKKMRFPRKDKRVYLRRIFDEAGQIPDDVLHDDGLFEKFNLRLPGKLPNQPNKFNRLNYETLGEYRETFDIRVIRNVIIKQNSPAGDDSSVYEIFNRLNSGGVNLTPQEIRASLYHSDFYTMLHQVNLHGEWRRLLGLPEPDLHLKDVEFLVRGFAILMKGDAYQPSMTRFLNGFSKDCKELEEDRIKYLRALFESFLAACSGLPDDAFHGRMRRFSISIFDAVFAAICRKYLDAHALVDEKIPQGELYQLKEDETFMNACQYNTARKENVNIRLDRARRILSDTSE